jgi:putative hemolysin
MADPSPLVQQAHRNLTVALPKSEDEVREAQRLRYEMFVRECGAHLAWTEIGIDRDAFDPYCDHLLVRNRDTGEVVGTYRILTSWKAMEAGRFYSETEFDLTNLHTLTPKLVEVGRSCIDHRYRQGAVLSLLWSGLAGYMITRGYEYLMGCASISLAEGESHATEAYLSLKTKCLSPDHWRVYPLNPFPLRERRLIGNPVLPPLIKGYVRLGAYVCGEPAWDRQFNTADLLMLLPLSQMNQRYARHFLGHPCLAQQSAA